jgi:hypothetical protein
MQTPADYRKRTTVLRTLADQAMTGVSGNPISNWRRIEMPRLTYPGLAVIR